MCFVNVIKTSHQRSMWSAARGTAIVPRNGMQQNGATSPATYTVGRAIRYIVLLMLLSIDQGMRNAAFSRHMHIAAQYSMQ